MNARVVICYVVVPLVMMNCAFLRRKREEQILKMYKDEERTIPALCLLRDMLPCTSRCALLEGCGDSGICIFSDESGWLYAGKDEPIEADGRER